MNIIVASRGQIERGTLPQCPFALVSITDLGSSPVAIPQTPCLRGVLLLVFDDTSPGDEPPNKGQILKIMTEHDSRAIWEFVHEHRDIDTLVVQCEAGWSRRGAIAAAVDFYFGEEAEKYFRDYSSNEYIFRLMLQTSGLRGTSDK